MQVLPETQVVEPLYPIPPHWPYLATGVPPEDADVAAAVLLVLAVVVEVFNVVELAEALTDEEDLAEVVVALPDPPVVTTTPPGPATLVVREPDST